ncbi:MAG: 16S rRNA (guanine(527)-N(7))-methyltransferase RsmG [Sulfitobacter sp.]
MGQQLSSVSRETMELLREYEAMVLKWTKKINLVSTGDAGQIWDRHIVDSIQVYDLAPETGDWLDLGSGGGFPGIVCAIIAKKRAPTRRFTLVDSDQRKCAFLRTVARELNLNVKVHASRVEALEPQEAAVLSARALGSLISLMPYMKQHLSPTGVALFPKGVSWKEEHAKASELWSYYLEAVTSATNSDAIILKIRDLPHA